MQPDVLDYASGRTPRRRIDWMRFATFFTVLCAVFAWLRTTDYLDNGQLREEQMTVAVFVVLSVPCLLVSLARVRRLGRGRLRMFAGAILCLTVLSFDALAVWNVVQKTIEWSKFASVSAQACA